VENASFMPWLVGTALIHSLAVTEKRGAFRSWTVLLAIVAFALSLLGTFLVRSGVLTSVHAFAVDSHARHLHPRACSRSSSAAARAVRLAHLAHRSGRGLQARFARVDAAREQRFLCWAAGTVFLGTMFPLAMDALNLGKYSVGPPYFEIVFVLVMAPALS